MIAVDNFTLSFFVSGSQVIRVDRVSGAGFTTVEVLIEGLDSFAGYQLSVQAKNENYVARCYDVSSGKKVEGPVLACTPDLITIIDSDTGEDRSA